MLCRLEVMNGSSGEGTQRFIPLHAYSGVSDSIVIKQTRQQHPQGAMADPLFTLTAAAGLVQVAPSVQTPDHLRPAHHAHRRHGWATRTAFVGTGLTRTCGRDWEVVRWSRSQWASNLKPRMMSRTHARNPRHAGRRWPAGRTADRASPSYGRSTASTRLRREPGSAGRPPRTVGLGEAEVTAQAREGREGRRGKGAARVRRRRRQWFPDRKAKGQRGWNSRDKAPQEAGRAVCRDHGPPPGGLRFVAGR
ncbi:hypothetical protein Purlil1_5672 [Purpureocillium lilacinum]|uniref:Uncharacterized protein n=2 Tax=Purpureocillium lilacinum TaxID=33203 RepID=A0ABR0C206_PURLI|nr:hypothetical protein Purlil1_5672 [Purpureocillium lilacinum]